MNITQIKNRADDLLKDCKPQVIRILIIMALIGALPSLFSHNNAGFGMISMLLSILYIPFSHGRIVTALKVVRNNKDAINDEDALVGFKRYKELFFTYFLNALIIFVILFVIIMAFAFFSILMFGPMFANLPSISGAVISSDFSSFSHLISYFGVFGVSFILFFVILTLIIAFIMVLLSMYLFAVPYLLEQYNIKGIDAIKESFLFIKGNIWNLFKLQFSFIGWILLFVLVDTVLVKFLAFIPVLGVVAATVISSVLAIYVYMPKYIVSMAIFFEEIAYYRYK